jgi:small subunit ribosomal protein S8
MYWNLLSKIKNGYLARKEKIMIPFSGLNFDILKVLKEGGYLNDVERKIINKKNFLEIKLSYSNNKPVMSDFRLISTPSRHIYKTHKELKPVKQGYGLGVVSTSKGVMSSADAFKNKIGGEYLFEVW